MWTVIPEFLAIPWNYMNVHGIGSCCLILMDDVMIGIGGISGHWFRVRNWFPNVQHRGIGCILILLSITLINF